MMGSDFQDVVCDCECEFYLFLANCGTADGKDLNLRVIPEQVTAKGQSGLSPTQVLWETFWSTHFRSIPPEGQGSQATDPPLLPVTVGLLPGQRAPLHLRPAIGMG